MSTHDDDASLKRIDAASVALLEFLTLYGREHPLTAREAASALAAALGQFGGRVGYRTASAEQVWSSCQPFFNVAFKQARRREN